MPRGKKRNIARKKSRSKATVERNFREILKQKMAELEKLYQEEIDRLKEQTKKLEQQAAGLKEEKEAEKERLVREITILKQDIQQLIRAHQELEKEYKKLISPPLGYGYVVSVINTQARIAEVINQDGSRWRIFVARHVDLNRLKKGQPVLLNQALHIIDLGLEELRGHLVIIKQIDKGYAVIGKDIGGETTALIREGLVLEPGDQVIVDRSYAVVLAKIEREEQQSELLVKYVEPIKFDNIGGLDEKIETLKKAIIRPYINPDWYQEFGRKPPKGILLVGPPGCGKTMLVKALYNYLKDNSMQLFKTQKEIVLFHVGGPELQSWWVGMTEYFIRNLFKSGRKEAGKGKIAIIFFDEAESMFSVRLHGAINTYKNDYVTQFTAEMQGLETDPKQIVIVILASNRAELLDPAVIRAGRIDIKIEVPRPNKEATKDILSKYILPVFTFDQKYFQGFTDEQGKQVKFQTKEEVRDYFVQQVVEYLFTDEKFSIISFGLRDGGSKTLHFRDVLSGAIINSIIDKAVDLVMDKREETGDYSIGINLEILKEAVDESFKQEKILTEKLINEGEWREILAVLGIKSADIVSVSWTGGKEIEYGMRY